MISIARLARARLERSAVGVVEETAHDFSQYRGDTLRFCRDVLQVRGKDGTFVPFEPWDNGTPDCQAGILRSIDAGHPRIAVRSGHKTGKSTDIAGLAMAFVATRPGARVIITAPTDKQVERASWLEIKKFFRSARYRIPGRIYETARTGYKGPEDSEIFGFVAKNADAFSGPSGANMLIIVDEAAGIDAEIMEAIEGAAAGGAIVLMLGNPTQTSGPFFDAFHGASSVWTKHHLDSRVVIEHQEQHGFTPGLATRAWYERCVGMWGAEDARTEVRCHGNFPSAGASSIIGLALYNGARERYPSYIGRDFTPLEIGLDVARFGTDKSVAYACQGKLLHPPMKWAKADSIQLARQVRKWALEMRAKHANPDMKVTVRVDSIGVGSGVFDQLCTFDLSSTVGSEAWNSRDLKSRPH